MTLYESIDNKLHPEIELGRWFLSLRISFPFIVRLFIRIQKYTMRVVMIQKTQRLSPQNLHYLSPSNIIINLSYHSCQWRCTSCCPCCQGREASRGGGRRPWWRWVPVSPVCSVCLLLTCNCIARWFLYKSIIPLNPVEKFSINSFHLCSISHLILTATESVYEISNLGSGLYM